MTAPAAAQLSTTALVDWSPRDTMAHAVSLVRDGTLSIDEQGRVWRHFELCGGGGGALIRKPVIPARRIDRPTKKGYCAVYFSIRFGGRKLTRSVLAHCLCWTVRVGQIPDGLQINHIDLNKANNLADNHELVTSSGNIRHSYANGRKRPWSSATEWRPGIPRLTDEQKRSVIELRAAGKSVREIKSIVGISRDYVYRILKGDSRGG